MKHIIHASGGVGSYHAAKRVAACHGPENVIMLFADTMTEAPDLYDFLRAGADHLGIQLIELRDGRDIWQIFIDHRYLGNTRIDPCSYFLKRMLIRDWLECNWFPDEIVCYLGIDWSEKHRLDKSLIYWDPYPVEAPMCNRPYMDKDQMLAEAVLDGLVIPSLYTDGFPHNNCGGGCVKAGQGQFRMLLQKRPDTYAKWEAGELRVRAHLGKNVSILRDRRGGKTRPMTLREFRQRIQGQPIEVDVFYVASILDDPFEVDALEIGGCACAVGDEDEDTRVELALGVTRRSKT
jgi:hypothetical protein